MAKPAAPAKPAAGSKKRAAAPTEAKPTPRRISHTSTVADEPEGRFTLST